MDDETTNRRNVAISHAVYLFKDKSLPEIDRGFWPMVYGIERFLRTGSNSVPLTRFDPLNPRVGIMDRMEYEAQMRHAEQHDARRRDGLESTSLFPQGGGGPDE